MSCFDPTCSCSNAPKCKCQLDWDIRSVCMPSDVWNCPVRVNTAVWLIDNDENLHVRARKRDFEGIRGWFDMDDEVSFHRTVGLYCDQMIEEGIELSLWKQKKIEAELRIIKLTHTAKEEKCDCCEITYPESKIDLEEGKWLCKSCQNEYPYPTSLYEPGNTCPALFKIINALASPILKQEQELKETGNLLYLPPLSD